MNYITYMISYFVYIDYIPKRGSPAVVLRSGPLARIDRLRRWRLIITYILQPSYIYIYASAYTPRPPSPLALRPTQCIYIHTTMMGSIAAAAAVARGMFAFELWRDQHMMYICTRPLPTPIAARSKHPFACFNIYYYYVHNI